MLINMRDLSKLVSISVEDTDKLVLTYEDGSAETLEGREAYEFGAQILDIQAREVQL